MRREKMLGLLLPLLAVAAGCDDFGPSSRLNAVGELRWALDYAAFTRAVEAFPDTNDFILTVKDQGGRILYEGAYGDSPERLEVAVGTYSVGVVSEPFSGPAFDKPQYGDEQTVVVGDGESVRVKLFCTLRNAGIRLKIQENFLTSYPDGALYIGQGGDKLLYKYKETRIAYVQPGNCSLLMQNRGELSTLFTRSMAAREIFTLKVSAPNPETGGKIQVMVDTAKIWTSGEHIIGGDNPSDGGGSQGNGGSVPDKAYSVGQAAQHVGEKGIWLYGYIVGGDLTTAGKSIKTSDITKTTHLALADRSSVTAKSSCAAIELPQGPIREALNLKDNPGLIGKRIYLKGNIVESYFGTVGLKGTSDFAMQ